MGTNYYWEPQPPCPHCNREYERVHIGKSSSGWCFALHVADPRHSWDEHPKSLEEWQERWASGRIFNEYGDQVTPERMLDIITNRSNGGRDPDPEWFRQNDTEPGPRGLIRCRIDGRHCIGHGEGTYDLCVGEFS
jgi:hypothetical protein